MPVRVRPRAPHQCKWPSQREAPLAELPALILWRVACNTHIISECTQTCRRANVSGGRARSKS